LIAIAIAGLVIVLKQTVPSSSGTLRIKGLQRSVEVVRDREGVPHIYGATMADVMVGLGFVHAQDRFWQMESTRRLVQGRLAEFVGPSMVDSDLLMRTLNLYGHARRSLDVLPTEARANLEAYARGVNAYLERETGWLEPRLPPELMLLGGKPEPWQPADSIAIVKLLSLTLSGNLGSELRRLRLAAKGFTPAEIGDLMPPTGADGAPPMPDLKELLPLQNVAIKGQPAFIAPFDDVVGTGASNNWVLSGTRTSTGKPLLANDPHLRLQVPSIWYFAHLAIRGAVVPAFDAVGGTVPGSPVIVLGRTGSLAWGFTNTGADVQDLFIEKLNPDDPEEYLTPDGWRRFEQQEIVIRVRGGADRRFIRRTTRHGPVLPERWRDISSSIAPGYVAALGWTALSDDDTTVASGLTSLGVKTVADFIEHQRVYVVPMQSMVVADTAGNIAMIAPGRVPVRDPANLIAGRAPVPGWDARYDWKGFIPFQALPQVVNPPGGAIATANTRIVPSDYAPILTYDWDAKWRLLRIEELLSVQQRQDEASTRAAQLDVVSLADRRLKALMIAAGRQKLPGEAAMLDRLAAWAGQMSRSASEPLVFTAWVRETVRAMWQDDLGDFFERFWDPNADALIRVLEGRANGRDWCDDRTTPEKETCGDIVARSLVKALAQLTWERGPNRDSWRWGDVHITDAENRVFGAIPGLGWLVNIKLSVPGGHYTLDRGVTDFASPRPFAMISGTSMRAIYDLDSLDHSKFIHSTGQSGNPLSHHYSDFAERWARGDYIEIPTERAAVMERADGVWRLEPGQPGRAGE
jgi:penicillin amidase